ncbi:hypothetical protein KIPB_013210, partial [Kipferlia bialata]
FGFHFAFVSDDTVWAFWPHGETDPDQPERRAQMFTEADGWTHIRQPADFPRLFRASQWVRAGPLFVSFYQEYSDHGLDPEVKQGLGVFDSVSGEWRTLFLTDFYQRDEDLHGKRPLALKPDDESLRFLVHLDG